MTVVDFNTSYPHLNGTVIVSSNPERFIHSDNEHGRFGKLLPADDEEYLQSSCGCPDYSGSQMERLSELIRGGRLDQEISLRDIKINKAMNEEQVLAYIQGADKLISRFGAFPMFADSEVLRVVLDRDSLAATFTLLVSEFKDRVHCGDVEIVLEFLDIEHLRLEGFNYQNVVSNLTFDMAVEQSLYSQVEVPTVHVDLDTNFGVWATFTCSRVVVQRVETSSRKTGDLPYLKERN